MVEGDWLRHTFTYIWYFINNDEGWGQVGRKCILPHTYTTIPIEGYIDSSEKHLKAQITKMCILIITMY
jgi:hypothetical protein